MTTLTVLAAMLLARPLPSPPTERYLPPDITGIWETERCVVDERARTSSKSLFVFLGREWAIELMQFADETCTTPSLRAFFSGAYRITGPSSAASDAHEATFEFAVRRLTLYSDALVAQANAGRCGTGRWTRGVEQDVSKTGCLWVPTIAACPQEYDLVKVDENRRLLLGNRPPAGENLCAESRRAKTLRAAGLVRR